MEKTRLSKDLSILLIDRFFDKFNENRFCCFILVVKISFSDY